MGSRNVYRIVQSSNVVKYIKKQDTNFKRRIEIAYSKIQNNPKDPALLLRGYENKYRYRVGNFRIIYSVNDRELVIEVIDVGPRGQIYNRH